MNHKHLAVSAAAVAALSGAAAPAVTLAVPVNNTTASTVGSVAAAQTALLGSNTPKTVVLDPDTGAIVSVTVGGTAMLTTAIPDVSNGTDCASGDGCYYTPVVNSTYHNRSFSGSAGTVSGSWPDRNAWDSGKYNASVCWSSACSPEVGPNTYSTFGGSTVTGTSFTIH